MRKCNFSFLWLIVFSSLVASSLWATDPGEAHLEIAGSSLEIKINSDGGYRTSLDNFDSVLSTETTIRLKHLSFDPLVNPQVGTASSGAGSDTSQAYIVQFFTQAFEDLQKQITSLGGQVASPLNDNSLIIHLTPDVKAVVEQLPSVRWVGPYLASYKLNVQPTVATASNSAARAALSRYNILAMQKSMVSDVADQIKAIGGTLHHAGMSRLLIASLNESQLNKIAAMKEVLYIDSWAPTEDDMNMVRESQGANFLETVEGYTGSRGTW